MLADRLLTQTLDAVTANMVSVGAGLIMLLAAGGLRDGSLTVGDFVLFISYLGFITDFTDRARSVPGPLRTDRGRLRPHGRLLGDTRRRPRWWRPPHCYLRGQLPPGTVPTTITRHDRPALVLIETRGLTYRHPRSGAWHRLGGPAPAARHADGGDGARRCGQDNAPAGPPRPAAPDGGRDPVERPRRGRCGLLFRAAPRGVHGAGAAPVQRDAQAEHPPRAAGRSGGPGRRRADLRPRARSSRRWRRDWKRR